MRKILGMAIILVLVVCFIYGAGEVVYKQGNTEAIRGIFTRFYLDSLIQKGDGVWRTIEVPKAGTGYNLKVWLTDPYAREESLEVAIQINALHGVENPDDSVYKYLGVQDFGYDNKADTFYFYGVFSSIKYKTSTSTAGADANDSLACIHYSFSSGFKAPRGVLW